MATRIIVWGISKWTAPSVDSLLASPETLQSYHLLVLRADISSSLLCVSRERVNKRRVKEMVKEFTLLCRGLHGTEYTADY